MPAAKTLVTGAAGFLGLYLVEQLLARGDTVRVLVRRQCPELEALPVEIVRGDLRDSVAVQQACAGVDVVYHAASVAGIWGPWKHYYDINVLGTRNVLAACRDQGVAKLIYTSSPSVTFAAQDQEGIDEQAPYSTRWLCHYPHTKAIAEQEVLAAAQAGPLLACSLRPHLIWGPRDRHLIPRLIARAKAGQLRRVGDGQNLIDISYVENVAQAHLQAADALTSGSPVNGQAYFISQGEPVNCWAWIDELLALAGLPPVEKSMSAKAAWKAGAALEGFHRLMRLKSEPRMTRFLAAQLSKSHWFDISRAKRDFGYKPQVSTAEGMRRLADDPCFQR